jgi:hypothetical protein
MPGFLFLNMNTSPPAAKKKKIFCQHQPASQWCQLAGRKKKEKWG